jgi:hypothetical protein
MKKIGVIALFVVALLLSSALFYYASQLAGTPAFDSYKARKEDLYLSQQKIILYVNELNTTVKSAIENQASLESKVTELYAKADLPPPVINVTRTVQQPPITVTMPSSNPSSSSGSGSSPSPVTRAS